jgi:hypothetical protein
MRNYNYALYIYYCRRFGPGGPSTELTSEFIAACPCPDGLVQDGTQGGMRLVCLAVRLVGPRGPPPPPQEGPRPPFYRCKERVQMYNGGCSYALTCLAEKCLSPVYKPTWLSEK